MPSQRHPGSIVTHAIDGDRTEPVLAGWIDLRVLDVSGEPIGVVVDVHPAGPERPEWLVISTGLLGSPVAVPVHGAARINDDIVIAHHRQVVFTAPGNAELLTIDPVAARSIAAHFGLLARNVGASIA
jgi:hypothetical protein